MSVESVTSEESPVLGYMMGSWKLQSVSMTTMSVMQSYSQITNERKTKRSGMVLGCETARLATLGKRIGSEGGGKRREEGEKKGGRRVKGG